MITSTPPCIHFVCECLTAPTAATQCVAQHPGMVASKCGATKSTWLVPAVSLIVGTRHLKLPPGPSRTPGSFTELPCDRVTTGKGFIDSLSVTRVGITSSPLEVASGSRYFQILIIGSPTITYVSPRFMVTVVDWFHGIGGTGLRSVEYKRHTQTGVGL